MTKKAIAVPLPRVELGSIGASSQEVKLNTLFNPEKYIIFSLNFSYWICEYSLT